MPTFPSVLLACIHFEAQGSVSPTHIYVGAIQCYLPEDEEQTKVGLLDFDFFDDENLVVICRSQSAGCECLRLHQTLLSYLTSTASASIATVNYVDVGYQELERTKYVKGFREDLMDTTSSLLRSGDVCLVFWLAEMALINV
jgi:anaphase-promoting complex subunit 4